MNTRITISPLSAKRAGGFTMVEIAIALGVIAFALIAIIGILPIGLQTQRDVREETIVNQDARVLIEAIKTGGRDLYSDIGSYVVSTNGISVAGIPTPSLIQLLTENGPHTIILNSISGAVATRGSDLGFHYQVISNVTNAFEFSNTVLSNQVYEVRLRFAWPVGPGPNHAVSSVANRYVVRTLISGWYTNGVLYAQHYYQPAP